MKKIFIVILFIASSIAAFFVTKTFWGKEEAKSETDDLGKIVAVEDVKDSTGISNELMVASVDTLLVDENKVKNNEIKKKDEKEKEINDEKKEEKPVKISCAEVKELIMSGTFDRDGRIKANCNVEYDDLSDDDIDIQNNLQAVQDAVQYERWRDFEVIKLGYDKKGRVNSVFVRPIY